MVKVQLLSHNQKYDNTGLRIVIKISQLNYTYDYLQEYVDLPRLPETDIHVFEI